MISDRFNIALLQSSDVIPSQSDLPGNRNLLDAPLGDWLREALDVQDEDDAKAKLLDITAVYLWRNSGRLSWRGAVAMAREAIAWMAFARDVKGGGGFIGKTEPEDGKDAHTRLAWRIENTAARDAAFQWYGAKVTIREVEEEKLSPERMERAANRLRRNRGGRLAQSQPVAESQGSLF